MKPSSTTRVYPAESDPRQAPLGTDEIEAVVMVEIGTDRELARVFGPWVRGEDGSWMRDRRKRRRRRDGR